MVNKCVVCGCKSGYDSKSEKKSIFLFLWRSLILLNKWIKFVNRSNWNPTPNSVICIEHFEEELIINGKQKKLNWSLNPVPTIHTAVAVHRPSTLPTPSTWRKLPKVRVFQSDQLAETQFFQYRQMSGGNFLANLNEVQETEKILVCKSLMREQIDFWKKICSAKMIFRHKCCTIWKTVCKVLMLKT